MTPFAEADARQAGMHGYEPVRPEDFRTAIERAFQVQRR